MIITIAVDIGSFINHQSVEELGSFLNINIVADAEGFTRALVGSQKSYIHMIWVEL